MQADRFGFLVAVLLYAAAAGFAALVWRREFRQDHRALYALIFVGLLAHTWAMFQRGFRLHACPINNLYEALVFILWTAGAAYLVLGMFSRLRFLGVLVAPLLCSVGVFSLMPALDPPRGAAPNFQFHGSPAWQSIHAAFILLAYGAFALGAVAGWMYLLQSKALKQHRTGVTLSLLPPIARLESSITILLLTGFALLTGGIATGMRYLKLATGSYLSSDPFVLYSFASWLCYAIIALARWRFGQRGRKLAWLSAGSFAVLLLTFWGVYQLSGLHEPKSPRSTDNVPSKNTR